MEAQREFLLIFPIYRYRVWSGISNGLRAIPVLLDHGGILQSDDYRSIYNLLYSMVINVSYDTIKNLEKSQYHLNTANTLTTAP